MQISSVHTPPFKAKEPKWDAPSFWKHPHPNKGNQQTTKLQVIFFLSVISLLNQYAVSAQSELTESQWLNRPEQKCACLIFIFKTSRHQLWICLKRKCIAGCFNVAPLLPSASIAMNNQAWGEQKCFSAAPAPTINTFFLLCSQSGKDKRRECPPFQRLRSFSCLNHHSNSFGHYSFTL